MTLTALFTAILAFFILVVIVNYINSYLFLGLITVANIFIALSITPLFDPTDTFSGTSLNGVTQLAWMQLLYGFLVLLSMGKTAMRIMGSRKTNESMMED